MLQGITNIKYTVDGMLFDAAVDWNWQLHCYSSEEFEIDIRNGVLPIELYNCSKREWDIKMIYQENREGGVNFDFILEETQKWIEEQRKDMNFEEGELIMTPEEYIESYKRCCSNEMTNGEYAYWLSPDQALSAVSYARREMIETVKKYLDKGKKYMEQKKEEEDDYGYNIWLGFCDCAESLLEELEKKLK